MNAANGETICKVVSDLHHNAPVSVDNFGEFAPGERQWVAGEKMDQRCFRPSMKGLGPQVYIEGEWRS